MQFGNIEGLPDPLVMESGDLITDKEAWMARRRPELLELFRRHVYGRMPVKRPDTLTFDVETLTDVLGGKAICKQVSIHFSGPGGEGFFNLHLYVPKNQTKPVPAFLTIGHSGVDKASPDEDTDFWPISRILERGYAAAIINVNQIAPDRNGAFDMGVHATFDKVRTDESWGTLAAWGWGCSRCMDYFETDGDIDAGRVAVIGHSRGGKAALWCGAEDERFALVISNDSGCSGAAITRGKEGETIAHITKAIGYWFCENYKLYADNTDALPVDQHELIALIAPRFVYVSSATKDTWCDPKSEFLACVYAEPVYKLFGLEGVGSVQIPPPETPLHGGNIGYHLRTGVHDLTAYDWDCFLDFADKPGVLNRSM